MKKYIFMLLSLATMICATAVLTSCSKDDDNAKDGANSALVGTWQFTVELKDCTQYDVMTIDKDMNYERYYYYSNKETKIVEESGYCIYTKASDGDYITLNQEYNRNGMCYRETYKVNKLDSETFSWAEYVYTKIK